MTTTVSASYYDWKILLFKGHYTSKSGALRFRRRMMRGRSPAQYRRMQ